MNRSAWTPALVALVLMTSLFVTGCDDTPSGCVDHQRYCEENLLRICEGGSWTDLVDCSQTGEICLAGECVLPDDSTDGDTEDDADLMDDADGDEEQSASDGDEENEEQEEEENEEA